MTALAITSITNFLLAAETLYLAGRMSGVSKERFSAAWYFAGVLALLGLGALLGGIDHGFFEPAETPRYWIQRADWIVLGGVTFCLLMTTAAQFFPRFHRIVLAIALVQFVADTVVVLLVDSFWDVILNYVPVMLLLLAMNLASPKRSWWMVSGIVVLFAASGIQLAGFDGFTPLDHNGVYHVVSMLGVLLLYRGGLKLERQTAS